MDKFSLKLAELQTRVSLIQKEIAAEEDKFNAAVIANSPDENLEIIKERISFLKRKCALYKQAEKMRSNHF